MHSLTVPPALTGRPAKRGGARLVAECVFLVVAGACAERDEPPALEPAAGSPGAAVVNFSERAEATGLVFMHSNGADGDDFRLPWIMGSGVALLDYDRDGDLDVYFVQGALLGDDDAVEPDSDLTNRLFANQLVPSGNLGFVDVTDEAGVGGRGYGMGVAVGDVDNDADPDLFVTNFGPNEFYRNDSDGTFTKMAGPWERSDYPWSASASFMDYDRDGDLDLYVTRYVDFRSKNPRRCFGAVGRRDYCGPDSYRPVTDQLFRNDGDWRFNNVSEAAGIREAEGSGLGVVTADFDGDGLADIFVANDALENQLWMNQGDGRFVDRALLSGVAFNEDGLAEAGMGVTSGDFDADGDEDLFVTHLAGETNTLYQNSGSGDFFDVTSKSGLAAHSLAYTGFGTKWFDFDNDGHQDLFVANGTVTALDEPLVAGGSAYSQINLLFRNMGGDGFERITPLRGTKDVADVSRGAAFGDIDNDGDVDIVVANNNGPARLLVNEVGHLEHWLRVVLRGTDSSRDASGARVALILEGRPPVWRRAHSDGSYLSANDPRIHFGLGADPPAVDTIVVHWPSGRRERWHAIEADREIELTEGRGNPTDARR